VNNPVYSNIDEPEWWGERDKFDIFCIDAEVRFLQEISEVKVKKIQK
jgi:hypothetical protein